MASINQLAAQLKKKWGDGILSADIVDTTQRVSFGTLGADYPTGGGIPRGVIVTVAGLYHSGKTTGCAQIMAQYQKEEPDKVCIYADVEQTLLSQADYLVKTTGLSLDAKHFRRLDCKGKSAEEIFEILITLEQADDIGLILIDSIAALVSSAELDNDFTHDAGMRASIAKPLGKFLKMMLQYLPQRNNTLLLINQVRESKAPSGAIIYNEPCGYGPNYLSSLKIRFGKRTFTKGDKTDLTKGEDADGIRLNFSITKSRYNAIKTGGFLTYRYGKGLDADGDLIEIALKYGFINRPNAQTYELVNLLTGEVYLDANGMPLIIRSKANVIDYLQKNPDFKNEYVSMIHTYLTKSGVSTLLDEETMGEILEQEDSVENNIDDKDKQEFNSVEE